MSLNKRLISGKAEAGPIGFRALGFTGNGSTQSVSGTGFHPDIVWIKDRDTAYQHNIYFNSGGTGAAGWALEPSGTAARYTLSGLTGFANSSNGFTLGSNAGNNQGSSPNIAYCWKVHEDTIDDFQTNDDGNIDATYQLVSTTRGISTFTFTTPASPGSGTTVGHGLGTTPEVIIQKRTDATENWYVYHTAMGTNKGVRLDGTGAEESYTNLYGTVNSSVYCPSFTLSGNQPCIAWAMHSVDKFSKFAGYTGNGSTTGPTITLGFKPALLIIRRVDSGDNWLMFDSTRHGDDNNNLVLICNNNTAESNPNLGDGVDFLSNGFQPVSSDGSINANNGEYIYMAWADNGD